MPGRTALGPLPGFAMFEGAVTVTGKDPVKLSIPLNKEGVIRGRIVDLSGKPLPGVTVSVGKELNGVTDGNGIFQIQGVDARGYEVRIVHPEWVAERSVHVYPGAGEKKELGDVTVRKAGTLVIKMVAGSMGDSRAFGRAEIYLGRNSTILSRGRAIGVLPQRLSMDREGKPSRRSGCGSGGRGMPGILPIANSVSNLTGNHTNREKLRGLS